MALGGGDGRRSVVDQLMCFSFDGEIKKVVSKLPQLVTYIREMQAILLFLYCLRHSLNNASAAMAIIRAAILSFEKESSSCWLKKWFIISRNKVYRETLQNLHKFQMAGDPVAGLNIQGFKSSSEKLRSIKAELQLKEEKLERRVAILDNWGRQTWPFICKVGISVGSIFIPSTAANAVSLLGETVIDCSEGLINSALDDRVSAVMIEKELVEKMLICQLAVTELDPIRILVEKLSSDSGNLLECVEYVNYCGDANGVKDGMEKIASLAAVVDESIPSLREKAESCTGCMEDAAMAVLGVCRDMINIGRCSSGRERG